jgi:hypothetical protein
VLPDYPRLKNKLDQKLADMIKEDIHKDPFLSGIPQQIIHEGNTLTAKSVDGFLTTTDYPEVLSKFEITIEQATKLGPKALFLKRPEIAKDMIQKLTIQFINCMEKVTEKTGNIVKTSETDQTSNPFLEMLNKIEIDFDDKGNPIMPTLLLSPEDYERYKVKFPEWEKNPKMEERRKEIIAKKKKEWLDRENSRKLVD